MSKIAIIKTGGKQYKVAPGTSLKIEKLEGDVDNKVKFDTLLTANEDGTELNIGRPTLGDKVEGKIIEQGKAKKVMVTKYKNKTRYLRNVGHRQMFTKVEIVKIG
jgi:large subunit ribosomal protein L21